MDRDAIQQVLSQRMTELDEVNKRLEAVQTDILKQRLLKEEIRVLRTALNGGIRPSHLEKREPPKPKQEKMIDAVRRVLKASAEPLTVPQVAEILRREGRKFRKNDRTGTNTIRGLFTAYGEKAPEHRKYFRRLQMEDGTYYESLEKGQPMEEKGKTKSVSD